MKSLSPIAIAAVALGTGLGGCKANGPRRVPLDRFDYNTAIASSANEQMLLNLVRLRYSEVPVFLAVNSVLTQYVWSGGAGVAGGGGENLSFPAWTVGGSADVRYIERPTVTYSPLSGQEFASQLIAPVSADVVFSLVSSGWPPEQLLAMTIQRINDVKNVGFAAPEAGAQDPTRDFSRVIELVIELAKHNAIELDRSAAKNGESYLDFAPAPDAPTRALIDELKDMLDIERGLNRFRVTRRIVGREPDEVTIRMHSLVELMGLLSAGVEAPATGPDRATAQEVGSDNTAPLRVRCQQQRPTDAFVAVRYGESWFYVPQSDHASKRAFGLLLYLYQMQASQNQGAGPLLTVPVG